MASKERGYRVVALFRDGKLTDDTMFGYHAEINADALYRTAAASGNCLSVVIFELEEANETGIRAMWYAQTRAADADPLENHE